MPLRLLSPLFARNLFALLPLLCAVVSAGAYPAIANVYARKSVNLDGTWSRIIDPYDNGYYDYRMKPYDASPHPTGGFFLDRKPKDKSDLVEYDFDTSPTLNVPGDWNSQDPQLLYYEGTVWYRRLFNAPAVAPGTRLFLYFGAVNYEADVYLNGHKLGRHVGGFTPFSYEVTGLVRPAGNSLVVRVNNTRHRDAVPTVNTDWWNYGGITRDVLLVETPSTYISSFLVRLKPGTLDRVEARVQLDGPELRQHVTVSLPGLGLSAAAETDGAGAAAIEFPAAKLPLWSPEHPALNEVVIASDTDRTIDEVGFRSITTRGDDILLNGRPVFLRGVSIHEENPMRGGRAYSIDDDRMLLGWAKELGCNFVRLAHYPHNEQMARLADRMGIMVWEEVPVYWTIEWGNPETLANARTQLSDLIARDQNRASVVVWSVANETPVSDARNRFLRDLIHTARSLDGTRLVSAAMEQVGDPKDPDHKIVDDPLVNDVDLVSFNEYIGWYVGLPDDARKIRWTVPQGKPVFISEFGAGALQGFHADALTRFSEEFQAEVYRQNLAMLSKIPNWRGATPWILADFRSPRRQLPHIQDGWNRKGLIGQNGVKKEAFYVLQKFYQEKAREQAAADAR
ncbi:beta-glucuronidase [mine drainage metagenome]|uniref:Beta-glucuronidase n=1 Tax=mine drainage metagenome TaxID=410659 RepID=A0A1J5T238_9ZZZZ